MYRVFIWSIFTLVRGAYSLFSGNIHPERVNLNALYFRLEIISAGDFMDNRRGGLSGVRSAWKTGGADRLKYRLTQIKHRQIHTDDNTSRDKSGDQQHSWFNTVTQKIGLLPGLSFKPLCQPHKNYIQGAGLFP